MSKVQRIPVFVLRLLAVGATLSATIVMVTGHDSAQVFTVTFQAKYTNTPTFKYFVGVNAVASVYSFIVLFLPSKTSIWRLVLVLDLVMTLMLDSSLSAALGVAEVGKKGNSYAGWLPICGQVPKFCDQVTGALIAGFVAAILYFLLLLYSLHNFIDLLTT